MTLAYERLGVIRLEWGDSIFTENALAMNSMIIGQVINYRTNGDWWYLLYENTPLGPYQDEQTARAALLAAVIERIEG